jgi:pyruvate dehydrogenase E2 component (dihydrolipoamide acetyltransferase)
MATPIIMPKQGQSVESCIIAKWYKKKGDRVAVGDILFSYETDKASFDEEAEISGVLLDLFFEEGDDVPCFTNVCVIGNPGESSAEFNPHSSTNAPVQTEPANQPKQAETQNQVQPVTMPAIQAFADTEIRISPRAKNLAEKIGIDYRYANSSGPNGRIIEKDIIALQEAGVIFTGSARDEQLKGEAGEVMAGTGFGGRITTDDLKTKGAKVSSGQSIFGTSAQGVIESLHEEVKISNIRKVIAKTMQNSLSSTAQLTLNTSFDATDIFKLRKQLKESKEQFGLENITINDIIIYAVSRTLLNHRSLNAHLLDDRILYFKNVNVGVAVDTERGLMVPTLFNANQKSLNEISREVKQLVKDCQSGTINPDLLKNGSFTITNLGTLGIESFTPVLNPPQTGILGVNTIVQRAKEVDGEYIFYPVMGLSLTFDHRALDGAPAAKFLKELKNNLENFSVLLAR